MALRLGDIDQDERFATWVRIASRIKQEHIGLGWNQYVFRLLRAVFNANGQLRDEGGFILNAISDMYVTHALMVFRRDMDRQSNTENLVNLLIDMKEHCQVITRARFLSAWSAQGPMKDYALEVFQSWNPIASERGADRDYVPGETIADDLRELQDKVDVVRTYAERTRAHRTRELDPDASVTFADMHAAIDRLRQVINKYSALLTGASTAWEPVAQFNVVAPFKYPWLPDDRDVIAAVLLEADEGARHDV